MFTLSDLPYAYNALEPYIDERTMQIHHDKHHAAYVKNLNDVLPDTNLTVEEVLRNLEQVPEAMRTKVRNNGGGHVNHSFFWQVMAANPDGAPRQARGDLGKAIDATFGSFEKFKELFGVAALNRFGSGWAWLTLDNGSLEIEDSANQDSPIMEGRTPILGLDVWEHAYYFKYQNMRADYIREWWNVVNWAEVEKRFGQV